jgi:hypothetical protein
VPEARNSEGHSLDKERNATLSDQERANLEAVDQALRSLWDLGRYVFLVWSLRPGGIGVLRLPHEQLITFMIEHPDWVHWPTQGSPGGELVSAEQFLMTLMSGRRLVSDPAVNAACKLLQAEICDIPVPYPLALQKADSAPVDSLLRRFGMNFQSGRAVVLLDIVDFSLFRPLEQVTQIHSLSASLNWAHSRLQHRQIDVSFARSTTGDGFYIWNRDGGPRANINLYHLMHLTLANNALQRRSAPPRSVPEVKTAFHIGSYYDIYLSEGLRPAADSVIVGTVTVELGRILGVARPGQILVGDFSVYPPEVEAAEAKVPVNSVAFIDAVQPTLSELQGIELLGDRLLDIRSYLTGPPLRRDAFDISRFKVIDKHQRSRVVYNAKVNIVAEHGRPVYLGLQHHEVDLPETSR